jgi:hypothetical protein
MSGQSLPTPPNNQVAIVPASASVTVEIIPRRLTVHYVSGSDLDTIASLGNSIHLTFFGLCSGAAITFWVVLKTANVTDPRTHADFIMLCAGAVVGAVYFGIRGIADYRRAKRTLKEIKSGKI